MHGDGDDSPYDSDFTVERTFPDDEEEVSKLARQALEDGEEPPRKKKSLYQVTPWPTAATPIWRIPTAAVSSHVFGDYIRTTWTRWRRPTRRRRRPKRTSSGES